VKRLVVVVLIAGLVLSIVGVAALSVLGSGGDDSPTPAPVRTDVPTTTPAPGATEPPSPALAPYYSQQLAWSPCRDSFLCAALTVPLDYRHPDGETIDLAVLKVPAADPSERIGSLVVNPGGPGAPGTDYAEAAGQVFRDPVLDAYDVVGFDPRGTGDSSPVDCLSDEQLDAFLARDPDPDTPAEVADYAHSGEEFWRGCVEKSGDLSAHISTIESARDIDVLRAALGESTLTYFGASYGTDLGATYADLFPTKVGRLVLDGAVDLSISSRQLSLEQAGGFETALRSYVQHCVDGDDCFLGDTVDAGVARIKQFLDDVDGHPLDTSDGRELTEGSASSGIAFTLYSRDFWTYLTQGLEAAFGGDGSLLLALADAYSSRGHGGYTDNSMEAFPAISCLDDPYAVSAAQVPANVPDFEKASPTFGRIFAWGLNTCAGIQVRSTEKPRAVRAAGAAPIVVVGTTRDPATPYAWAVHLADQLESGVLVSRDGDGHTGYNEGNECVDSAVEDYLIDGTVPKDGLEC
jgi:pimeloyl-ACP methyl ester carboxylesterase